MRVWHMCMESILLEEGRETCPHVPPAAWAAPLAPLPTACARAAPALPLAVQRREAEEWRLQQLRTGAADDNANFAVSSLF